MKRSLLLSLLFLLSVGYLAAQTSLAGKVTDIETGEPILFGNVALYKNGNLITGVETDFDGNYAITSIDPGTYDVEVTYVGYQTKRVTGVIVYQGKVNKLDIEMGQGVTLEEVEVVGYKVPLIEQDNTTQGASITAEQIQNLPTRNINALAATTAGVSSNDDGGTITFRGSRSDATNYYVDGIRVSSTAVPTSEIDQLQMITGGIEAQYGDVTGGIISITTKGPSSKFSGGVELETSEYLDDYGNSLLSANFSGPIFKNAEGRSILGFRVAAQYTIRDEDDPPATPLYILKDDVRDELAANPVTVIGETRFPSAELLTDEDVNALDASPYQRSTNLNLNAKLDARITDNIDVTLTGAYIDVENQFSPSNAWITINSFNNPFNQSDVFRGNLRFRHRFGNASGGGSEEAKASVIRNASYTLQFGYEVRTSSASDPRHGDNYWNYGYIGEFGYEWVPIAGTDANGNFRHIDYRQEFVEGSFNPSAINQGLVNYNNVVDQNDVNDFIVINGQNNDAFTSAWGLHTNINQIYNSAQKNENELYTFIANSSFDFMPGGSEKGRHNIQFGIWYEQRVNRFWNLSPFGLWQLARLNANNHLTGVDTNMVVGRFPVVGVPGIDSLDQYAALADPDITSQGGFWKAVREATGQDVFDYVNTDGLSPDMMSLDMFNPQELTDVGIIGFAGYDYTGNEVDADVTFDDFWTIDPETGQRSFLVAPFRPNYTAAYIQDKFTFKDIIFRLGLRVDRFDANQKVLRDQYSFYEIMGASEFHSRFGGEKPSTIGDDYKVYLESPNSTSVKAYRDENTWFFPNGTQANTGAVIFGGEVVNPALTNPEIRVSSPEYDPNTTFEDYEPQVNWMPRLAFSFPISDVANFYAHYDVLVQRPTNNLVSPLTYFYFNDPGRFSIINNPNLRPQKTIDYAVGFQQRLTNSSAIKINAYYREMRDMIQAQTIPFVYILNQYDTYGNQDFGTVKGFTFQYDLRRTGNVSLRIDYTLQFADGTGSNANSQRGLTQRGNLRTLFPLSFDERHRVVANFDYRYASGKRYNGPRWFGADVFANTGFNLITTAFSGRPYTRRSQPEILGGSGTIGSINGARLPWTFRLDFRIDKTFLLYNREGGKPVNANVYMRISNLLDTRNIIGVYPATGSATDDGFLATARGQSALNDIRLSGRDVQPYLDAYQWRLLNPDLFSLPRRIFVGTIINF